MNKMMLVAVVVLLALLVLGTIVSAAPINPSTDTGEAGSAAGSSQGGTINPVVAGTDNQLVAEKARADAAEQQLAEAKRKLAEADEAARKSAKAEIRGDHHESVRLQRIAVTKVTKIREELGPEKFAQLMRSYGGPASVWARQDVQNVLATRLLDGRAPGTTPDSKEWRSPTSKEELAVGLNRAVQQSKDYTNSVVVGRGKGSGTTQPSTIPWGKIIAWILVILAVLALIGWLLRRRRVIGVPALGATPPFAPVGPAGAGGVPAPAAPFVSFSRGISRRFV